MSWWDLHPGVRSGNDLTLGERAADRLRNGMGSWNFVFSALIFLAAWMFANGTVFSFDKYPYILLNLTLSCLAALQGAILLIAAKRSDQVAAELAQHDLDSDLTSEEILRNMKSDFQVLAAQHAEQTKIIAKLQRDNEELVRVFKDYIRETA